MLQAITFDVAGTKRVVVDGVEMDVTDAELSDTEFSEVESHQYVEPIIQVPQIITIRQAKLVLLAADLLDDVDAAVAQADRATQIEWEYATEVNRQWPTLLVLASALGLDSDDLDGLFIEGSKL